CSSLSRSPAPPAPHSFPTRRSSDLSFNHGTGGSFTACHTKTLQVRYQCVLFRLADQRLRRRFDLFVGVGHAQATQGTHAVGDVRSEEHTSELQSRENLVCRLLLEKK